MNTRQRELVCNAKNKVLNANHSDDVRQAILPLTQEYNKHLGRGEHPPTSASSVDAAHDLKRAQSQVFNAAISELVTDKAIARLGKLLPGLDLTQLGTEEQCRLESGKYTVYSPTLRRSLSALDICFGAALRQVSIEHKQGSMPAAAIWEVAEETHPEFVESFESWKRYSNDSVARLLDQKSIRMKPTFEAHITEGIDNNILIGAAMMVGRGLARDVTASPDVSKTTFAASQLPQMAAMSTITQYVSIPILDSHKPLLTAYSRWENGDISAVAFRNTQNLLNAPDAVYHRSLANGAWDKIGHCAANLPFSEDYPFTTLPDFLVDWLDMHNVAQRDYTPAHVFLGSAIPIADQTIYANWPE